MFADCNLIKQKQQNYTIAVYDIHTTRHNRKKDDK